MDNLYREASAAEILHFAKKILHVSLSLGRLELPVAGCLARTE
jgi:hypothetical protein